MVKVLTLHQAETPYQSGRGASLLLVEMEVQAPVTTGVGVFIIVWWGEKSSFPTWPVG